MAFRPVTDVYVSVDLCGVTNRRLHEAEGGTFTNAECFEVELLAVQKEKVRAQRQLKLIEPRWQLGQRAADVTTCLKSRWQILEKPLHGGVSCSDEFLY
jgi:hypothetical protein